MAREQIIAGNWKMHKNIDEAEAYIKELATHVNGASSKVYVAVPFTAIHPSSKAADGTKIFIGAQNMNDASEGAFTGEIAGKMLVNAGAHFVLLGHSERRHIFGEEDAFVNKKVLRALEDGLEPIVCVGETLEQREQNQAQEVVKSQIEESLDGLDANQVSKIVLAYEPVWAIGTGLTAKPNDAQEMHAFCRSVVSEKWGEEVAANMQILYGGSVKPENTVDLINQPDIDGVLVGGASLTTDSFGKIIQQSNT